ncbi:hypothetical protein GUJ93_ZPchr0001g30777 [Zizania palustris]|uniref:Zinc finger C2H2 LYAR-type domain-containing protein n=1 Tax=Zizania palustris TaxID=103762 RepID=A0A8J5V5D4_ZIZPA|nr:hypothetical protein GUJ93_ZPchr0001g30777 [Zizania palustris]
MVWFQCEDCGENLKKPKLAGHFRSCSAYKLSCIDCGQFFNQDTVQAHTQCISEAEKYGPKGQNKQSNNTQGKQDKPKPNTDVDTNVGLLTYPPWFCSQSNSAGAPSSFTNIHTAFATRRPQASKHSYHMQMAKNIGQKQKQIMLLRSKQMDLNKLSRKLFVHPLIMKEAWSKMQQKEKEQMIQPQKSQIT